MINYKIRQIFQQAYDDYSAQGHYQSDIQHKAARAILNCKSGRLGINLSQCTDCGHLEVHNNSCRNRSCPNCQAVLKEIWVDKRRAEVIDSPYFHVVFTLPHELNPLIYCNHRLLYGLLHRYFSASCKKLRNSDCWKDWKNNLYEKDWCPYIKETFNSFGNAIEYLGRYTHKIAIGGSRILSVSEDKVTFSARGKKPGAPKRQITLDHTGFIKRYLMHVLPSGFQKIRYYGFLNNRMKHKNLKVIFKLQNVQRFKQRFAGLTMAELLNAVWNFDICLCPECGHPAMKQLGRCYAPSS